jgi:hypothetical protein
MKKTTTVLGGAFMVALLVFAGVAQGSGPNPAHLQELTALNNRYQGQVKQLAASRGSYVSHLEDLTALNNRYQGQVKQLAASRGSYVSHLEDLTALKNYTLPLVRPAPTSELRRDSPSAGFTWEDAAIGAATAVMLITLIGGSTLLCLRIQRRHRIRAT